MITTTDLTKIYTLGGREIRAIDGISLNIEKGEFITIIGRSGSGKSTLLHQLGLLDNPTKGIVKISGKDTSKFSALEKTQYRLNNLGYVFQEYALIPTLTAMENIAIVLLMQGLPTKRANGDALQALDQVGLSDRANNLPSQLSGGEQQRVGIARAIVNSPLILFADEPTANLDSETARIILRLLQKLNNEGQTLIMVTHEKAYSELSDKVIALSDGKVVSAA